MDPIRIELSEGDVLHTVGPPGSGAILGLIMNIINGYNFTPASIADVNATVLTYHRIIESFKYAFAMRTNLGDTEFVNITELIGNLTSKSYADGIREAINDTMTSESSEHYGASFTNTPNHGTAHISVITPNGDAVSVTSSTNYYFGSGWTANKTGLIMNNAMDDFGTPGFVNYFGLPASPANYIAPHKRPLSSMSPSVLVDKNGEVKMVIGASGGTRIITAVALVAIRHLWLGQDIKAAVDAPRFHHQLLPMVVNYQYGIIQEIVSGLKAKGHQMSRYTDRSSIVCAVAKNETAIYANADYRKGGDVFGID